MSKKPTDTPASLQKIFITGIVTFYAAMVVDNLVLMLRTGNDWREYILGQVLVISVPLIVAVGVYLSKKRRELTLSTLFQVMVATFGLTLLFAAIMSIGTFISTEMMKVTPAAGGTVHSINAFANTMYMITISVAFIVAMTYFVFAIRSARRRGEW